MDNFLLKKVGGSANHSVDLSLLHSFKRMRRFQPFSAIVEALKTSSTLDLIENDTQIRRKVPLPESVNDFLDPNVVKVFENEAMARSAYVKGFGEEGPTTQFDIEAFFAPHGPTNAIRLRRAFDKKFKGSVFVEFDTEETLKKFLALDPQPKWKGQDLIIKSKKEYCDEKVRDIESGKIKASSRGNNSGRDRGRGRGRGGRGGRGGRNDRYKNDRDDRRDWRERRDNDQKRGFREDKPVEKDSRYAKFLFLPELYVLYTC
jgi:lupus La protein